MDKLVGATAFRDYATQEQMPDKIKEMVERAISEDLNVHCVQVECSEGYEDSGEYHIVLWAS